MNRPGERVGPYELVELIAARPLANLWRAERVDQHTREPRVVVLRIAHHTMDTRAMSELRREYDALRAVDDPRVRKAFGFYAGFGALALEYVEGATLRAVVQHAQAGLVELDVATIVDLAVELANALRAVHERGVVHGRVCVDTVRIRRDGGVVLTDFALPLERLAVLPPELKSDHAATPATDQWLLGALIVHLITREALLTGLPGDQSDGRRDLRPWIEGVSTVNPALGRMVARMLARDPRDRHPDLGPLVRELLALLRSLDARPDRERLGRKMSGRPAPTPPPMPPPTPVLAPAPVRRDVRLRPLPSDAQTLPPERGAPALGRPDPATDLELPEPTLPGPRRGPPARPPGPEPAVSAAPARPTPRPLALDAAARLGEPAGAPTLAGGEAPAPVVRPAPARPTAPSPLPPVPGPMPTLPPDLADTVASSRADWTPAPDLVPAVHEEEATDLGAPVVRRPLEPTPAAPADRLVPDWIAAVALVLLLGVGVWAVLSRIL